MISIIMSIFNERFEWIKLSIESMLNQTYSDYELIIIVDNPQIPQNIKRYLDSLEKENSKIIICYNSENVGLALSLNKALKISKGQYIARMDADDISMKNRLEVELDFIKRTNSDVVFSNRILIDEEGNEILKCKNLVSNVEEELLLANVVVHPTVLMKSEVVKRNGGYRNFRRSQDYDLWLRLLTDNCKFAGLDRYLLYYRISSNNLSKSNKLEQYYANKYQKKLYIERKKYNGRDSFSEKKYKQYIDDKHITDRKNKKALKCFEYLEKCRDNKISAKSLLYLISAFFIMPNIFFEVSINALKKIYKRRKKGDK